MVRIHHTIAKYSHPAFSRPTFFSKKQPAVQEKKTGMYPRIPMNTTGRNAL